MSGWQRYGLAFLSMMAGASAVAAEPVVVPEFSFGSQSEFAVSVMLQSQLADQLTADGHIVLTHEMLAREVGAEKLDGCMERQGCPSDILPRVPARVAVIAKIAREDEDLVAHVEIWEQSRTSAMEVRDLFIAPGGESEFIVALSQTVGNLLNQLPPSSPETLMAAARMVTGQPASGGTPAPQPTGGLGSPYPPAPQPTGGLGSPYPPAPQPTGGLGSPYPPAPVPSSPPPAPVAPAPVAPAPSIYPLVPGPVETVPTPAPGGAGGGPQPLVTPSRSARDRASVDYSVVSVEEAIEGTPLRPRHLTGARNNLIKSGLDPRDWLYKRTPHAGRLIVEPRVGLAIGDVGRFADVRIAEIDGAQAPELDWYQEGPVDAQGIRGELFLGYAPTTVVDFGVLAGLQYGKRTFSSGFYRQDELVTRSDEVDAVQFVLQPRLRVFAPFGPVKPFIYGAGDFRFFDSWNVSDTPGLVFPKPIGGIVPGAGGGVGILIDPSPIVGFFVEGGYIRHFGTRSAAAANSQNWTFDDPPIPPSTTATIPIVGGVQFRL